MRDIYNAFPKSNFLSGGEFGLEGGNYYYFERYERVKEVELG